jgi:protein-tyrosine phosphatase
MDVEATGNAQTGRAQAGPPDYLSPADVRALALADGRRIELTGLLNLRDVGGYPAAGHSQVRWRALFRSDALNQLDAAGQAALAGLGLRTIVDLRTQPETEFGPTPLDRLTARHTHISVLQGDLADLPLELDAIYRYIIEDCGVALARAITAVAAADGLPALVHCSAGKDRTGVVIALILAVLGVPDEVIAADYALSAGYLDPDRTPVIGHLRAAGAPIEESGQLLISPPALILDVLARVRRTSRSAAGYLLGQGMSQASLDRLRSALLVPR